MSKQEHFDVRTDDKQHELQDKERIALERVQGIDRRLRELQPWLDGLKASADGEHLAFRRELEPFQCTAVYVVPLSDDEPTPVHACWRISCSAPGKKRFVWMVHRSALTHHMDGVRYFDDMAALIDEVESEVTGEIERLKQKGDKIET